MSTQPELPALVVAMDWGGTWIRAATVDANGQVRWQDRTPTPNPQEASQSLLVDAARALLDKAIAQCGGAAPGVGIAVAGPVDAETGTLYDPPNLKALDGVSLKSLWQRELGCPVYVGNDATLAALGEYHYGAGRESREHGSPPKTLVYMTISTGIGGGVVDRGQMFLGARGLAGEVGHMTIDHTPSAPSCLCGSRGCLETLASGTAIARIAGEKVAIPGGGSTLAALATDADTPGITSQAVFEAAGTGDALAQEIIEDVVNALGVGLTNVLHLFNPDIVVLGGGVTVGLEELGLIGKIRAIMDARAMSRRHKDFVLTSSRLGDAVGIIGAAAMVQQEMS